MRKKYALEWCDIAWGLKVDANHKCQCCGVESEIYNDNGKQLSVHHLDGDTMNNKRSNLIVVCARCHLQLQHVLWVGKVLKKRSLIGVKKRQLSLFEKGKKKRKKAQEAKIVEFGFLKKMEFIPSIENPDGGKWWRAQIK